MLQINASQCFQIWMARYPYIRHGLCYTSQALTSVIQVFSINHITSSPHYPQSNGLAEKYVQIVKCLFKKAKEEGKDFYKCLMIYYNTPLTGSLQLPMQILQGRSGSITTFFFACIFLFLNKALGVPIYLGSLPTEKAYCSYVPTFHNKNIRVSFLLVHLLKKPIYVHTNKMI